MYQTVLIELAPSQHVLVTQKSNTTKQPISGRNSQIFL